MAVLVHCRSLSFCCSCFDMAGSLFNCQFIVYRPDTTVLLMLMFDMAIPVHCSSLASYCSCSNTVVPFTPSNVLLHCFAVNVDCHWFLSPLCLTANCLSVGLNTQQWGKHNGSKREYAASDSQWWRIWIWGCWVRNLLSESEVSMSSWTIDVS